MPAKTLVLPPEVAALIEANGPESVESLRAIVHFLHAARNVDAEYIRKLENVAAEAREVVVLTRPPVAIVAPRGIVHVTTAFMRLENALAELNVELDTDGAP